jgi:GntR family transcriptional regulator
MPTQRKPSKRPLYVRVRELLERKFAQRKLESGSRLPSEDQLARELGVSLRTVRQALDQLENEQLSRRREDAPTTGASPSRERADRLHLPWNESEESHRGGARLLRQVHRRATEVERERLQLDSGERLLATERVRYRAGAPFMYEKACLAVGRLPSIRHGSVGNYCLTELARQCGVHLGLAREQVSAARASALVAKHLGVEPHASLIKLDRVVYTRDGLPVEWRVGLC